MVLSRRSLNVKNPSVAPLSDVVESKSSLQTGSIDVRRTRASANKGAQNVSHDNYVDSSGTLSRLSRKPRSVQDKSMETNKAISELSTDNDEQSAISMPEPSELVNDHEIVNGVITSPITKKRKSEKANEPKPYPKRVRRTAITSKSNPVKQSESLPDTVVESTPVKPIANKGITRQSRIVSKAPVQPELSNCKIAAPSGAKKIPTAKAAGNSSRKAVQSPIKSNPLVGNKRAVTKRAVVKVNATESNLTSATPVLEKAVKKATQKKENPNAVSDVKPKKQPTKQTIAKADLPHGPEVKKRTTAKSNNVELSSISEAAVPTEAKKLVKPRVAAKLEDQSGGSTSNPLPKERAPRRASAKNVKDSNIMAATNKAVKATTKIDSINVGTSPVKKTVAKRIVSSNNADKEVSEPTANSQKKLDNIAILLRFLP